MVQKLLSFNYFYETTGCKIYDISSYKRINLTFISWCKMAKRLVSDPFCETIFHVLGLV